MEELRNKWLSIDNTGAKIMWTLYTMYNETNNFLAYDKEVDGILTKAHFTDDKSVDADIVDIIYDAFSMIDEIVTTYLYVSGDYETIRYYGNIPHMPDFIDITNNNINGVLLYYMDFMFKNKFILWVGFNDDEIVDQVYASSNYKIGGDYIAIRSWRDMYREERFNLDNILLNFSNDRYLYPLLQKLEIATLINDVGYYIDDIIEIVNGATYLINKFNIPFPNAILEVDENVLIERVILTDNLFPLLVRLHELIPRCEIVNKINEYGEDLIVTDMYNEVVYKYEPNEDDDTIIPADNYNALYLLYLRDKNFNRDINDIVEIEDDIERDQIVNIMRNYSFSVL